MKILDVFVNSQSGTVLREGSANVAKNLQASLGEQVGEINFIAPDLLVSSITGWAASHSDDRAIIIGGGDGSVMTAATTIINQNLGITMGTLPLGTQNFVAQKMGFAAGYREAARQYREAREKKIDVGSVNGMYYLAAASFDRNWVSFYQARELLREKEYFSALQKVFDSVAGAYSSQKNLLTVSMDGGPETVQDTNFLTLSVTPLSPMPYPGIIPKSSRDYIAHIMHFDPQNAGHISLYNLTGGNSYTTSFLYKFLRGEGHRHPALNSTTFQRAVFTESDMVPNKNTVIVLDGEIKETHYPLKVQIHPEALSIYSLN
jgi:diacylglycerol kinase family enzyme